MNKINVMIIDDEELDRYLVKRTLSKFDVFGTVTELPDGSDALELVQSPDFRTESDPPSPMLVFLDVNMPKMSGFEFLDSVESLLHEQGLEWEHCVILMLTSSLNKRDLEQADRHELVQGYVEKPLTGEKLQDILDDHYRDLIS